MSLFQYRDERRRRLLTDEAAATASEGDNAPASPPSRRTISREAALRMDRLPRLTDLIPRNFISYALLTTGAIAAIAGFEALYYYSAEWAPLTTDGHIAAFDLDSEGSLATWFSSTTLMLAALVSWIVYLVRRQQPDDYHGRYRVWLWATGCWLLMSIDEGSSLHEGFKELMTKLTGQRVMGDGSVWWVAAYGLLLGGVGVRLGLEMRRCISSTTSLVFSAICYVAAVIVQMELVMPQTGALGVMVEEGCEMLGNVFLLLSMTLHARYVVLDAEGALPKKSSKDGEPRKTRKVRIDDEGSTPVTARRNDLSTSAPARITAATVSTPAAKPGMRVDAPQSSNDRKLSKQERKAIRRQMRDDDDE